MYLWNKGTGQLALWKDLALQAADINADGVPDLWTVGDNRAATAQPLAALFDSSRTAMHRTLLKTRKLLDAHGIVIPPATTPPAALTTLQARVTTLNPDLTNKIKTTC